MTSSSIEKGEAAQPDGRQLLSFGLIMAAAFAVMAGLRAWRAGFDAVAIALVAIAGAFAAAALIAPSALAVVYRPWMRLAEGLGWVNTRILLVLIFYLVVTPIGLIMRVLRRSPLDGQAGEDTYWTPATKSSYGDRHFEKQF